MRQSEQGQLIVPDLCIGNCGADNRFLFHGESPFRLVFNVFCGNGGKQRLLLPILCGQPVALRLIVVLHRGGGVQDGGAQIGHDVLDGLGGVGHHIEDVLHVLAGHFIQPQPNGFSGLRLLADVLSLSWTAVHLHNVVQQFLQLVGVVPLGKGVDLQPFPELLPHLCFHLVKICGFACRP